MEKDRVLKKIEETSASYQRIRREKQLNQSRSRRLFLILYYKATIITSKALDNNIILTAASSSVSPITESHIQERANEDKSDDVFQMEFSDQKNSSEFKNIVIKWLLADWRRHGFPFEHFWHNRDFISGAFDDHSALIAFNQKREFVGFMVWNIYSKMRAEIEFVNVKETYRRQGVFKQMQNALLDRFPEVCVLTATVLPQARIIFACAGWKQAAGEKHFRMIQTSA